MSEPRWLTIIGVVVLTATALVLGGCDRREPVPSSDAQSSPAAAPQTIAAADFPLAVVDRAQYDQLLQRHVGQVVLVDFWATWCLPCVQQFAHTVELAGKHHDRGLAVISVSMNDPTERDAIEAFLQRQKAGGIENLVSGYGAGPRSMEEFDITGGALPHYKLYDRTGKLRYTFGVDPAGEPFTLEEVDARVAQLLAE